MVPRSRRNHPPPGKYWSIVSRQSATGSRNRLSRFQGIGSAAKPPSPLVNTVPLKRNTRGTSPEPRPCRNFDPATSKS